MEYEVSFRMHPPAMIRIRKMSMILSIRIRLKIEMSAITNLTQTKNDTKDKIFQSLSLCSFNKSK